MEAELRSKVANFEICRCASALVLQMESTAKDVCMAPSSGKPLGPEGANPAPTILRDYSATDALGVVDQHVARFLIFKRTHPIFARINRLFWPSRMGVGGTVGIAPQMRRLFGLMGGSWRQDIPRAEDSHDDAMPP